MAFQWQSCKMTCRLTQKVVEELQQIIIIIPVIIHQSRQSSVKWNGWKTHPNHQECPEEGWRNKDRIASCSIKPEEYFNFGDQCDPAQLLFSQRLRDTLPVLSNKLLPHVVKDAKDQLTQRQQKTTEVHKRLHSTQHWILTPGTPIRFRIENG